MKVKKRFILNGKQVSEAEWRKHTKCQGVYGGGAQTYSDSKPLESLGASCHPSQVAEMNANAQARGLTGVRWRPDGMCEFTSRGKTGRAGYLTANGIIDRQGGYGDG